MQILWVNLVTAVTLSLALAGEPAERDIMSRPPRPAGSHVVTPRLLALVVPQLVLTEAAKAVIKATERPAVAV